METYLVKFWIKNKEGFIEQKSEIVKAKDKDSHLVVESIIMKKYMIDRKDVIGVYYQ